MDDTDSKRRTAKNAWQKQFDERNNVSTHVGADIEEGEVGGNYVPVDPREVERRERLKSEGLWSRTDEEYYNEGECGRGVWVVFWWCFGGAITAGWEMIWDGIVTVHCLFLRKCSDIY